MRLKMLVQICRYLILICIKCICLRMILQCIHDLIQCIRSQQVIMVEKSHKFALCHGKSTVCILRNAKIFFQVTKPYPDILCRIICQNSLHLFIIRTCIRNTQFPFCVSLADQWFYHLLQKFYGSLIGRHRDTEQWCIVEFMFPLFLKCFFIRNISRIPWTIRHFFRFKTFMQPDPEFFRAIMLQITKTFLNRIRRKFLQHFRPLDLSSCRLFFSHILTSIFTMIFYFNIVWYFLQETR